MNHFNPFKSGSSAIGLLVLILSCNEPHQSFKHTAVNLHVRYDTLDFADCYLRSTFQLDSLSIAIIEDNSTNTNLMYNLNSKHILDTLHVSSPWVAGRLINSSLFPYLEWLDSNHIMFEDLNVPDGHPESLFIYNTTHDSIVFRIPTSVDSSYGLTDLIFSFYSNSPPAILKDKVVGMVVKRFSKHLDAHFAYHIGEINLNSKNTRVYDVQFPYDEPKGEYAFLKEYYTCFANNKMILSTSLSNAVVIYDLQTHRHTKRIIKSRFHRPIQTPKTIPGSDKVDLDALEEQQITSFQYLPIYHDTYRNIYYRGYKRAQNIHLNNGRYATGADKATGMLVFNSAYEIIGEYEFQDIDSRAFQYASGISALGLTLQTKINDTTHILKTYLYEP